MVLSLDFISKGYLPLETDFLKHISHYTSEINKKCAGLLLLGVRCVSGIAALQGTHTHCKELQAHALKEE